MTAVQLKAPSAPAAQPCEQAAAPPAAGLLPLAGSLDGELAATAASYLEPNAFFVSWQGVLTLAFRWASRAWQAVVYWALAAAAAPAPPPACCRCRGVLRSRSACQQCTDSLPSSGRRWDPAHVCRLLIHLAPASCSGFTAPLVDLKRRLSAAHPCLPPENPGSLWPKMSLGCLRDGRRLTPDQLALLCRICG